jgi:hypothetical protein
VDIDNKEVWNSGLELIDLNESGKLIWSDGALNLKACFPISLKILGTIKKVVGCV